VAITSPDANGQQVIVNITSNGDDPSCVLQADDHPFLKYNSVVSYKDAVTTNEVALNGATTGGALQGRAPFRPEVLRRIQDGAIASPQTPLGVKAVVKSELGLT
jgi:hypothetical protein